MKKVLRKTLNDISYFIGLERFGFLLSKRVFWRADTKRKVIALTFDDGPNPIFTPQILEILDDFAVHATFFLIGSNVNLQPRLTKQIFNSGHQIGNHTFTHPTLTQLGNGQIESEILEPKKAIENICSVTTLLMRTPYWLCNRKVLAITANTNHKSVIGDVYPRDTALPGTQKLVSRVLKRTRCGSVIILHDGAPSEKISRLQTVEGLRKLIPTLQERGFRFVSLPELMDIDHT